MIKLFVDPVPHDGLPYVVDWRSFDIPETVAEGIKRAPPGLVAITLSRRGGRRMIDMAERAAEARGAWVIWWTGPGEPLTPYFMTHRHVRRPVR